MKRDPRLRGLSSEHHQALVLARRLEHHDAWCAADGRALATRFAAELEPHFHVEEELLLPALRAVGQSELAARTDHDHAAIRGLVIAAASGDGDAARRLGQLLTQHVRWEERELFPACEAHLASAVLDEVARRTPPPR